MKKFLQLLIVIICLFLSCSGCGQGPIGSGDEVTTGTVFGKLLVDGEPTDDTVDVYLYSDEPQKNAEPVDSLSVHDGRYEFEELREGTYRIEVVREAIVVGEKKDIILTRESNSVEVNIEITVIINQTFNIEIVEKNITINNFFIDNGKIDRHDSVYVVTSIERDTVEFDIELLKDGDTVMVTVKGIRDERGHMTFAIVENPVEMVITAVENRADGEITIPVEKSGEITIESPFDTSGAPEEGK